MSLPPSQKSELDQLIDKIVETIRRDVNNIFTKASGASPLPVEQQDALVRYHKALTDFKTQALQAELERKLALAEEAYNRATSSGALAGPPVSGAAGLAGPR
jgi:hypothetical protein